MIRGLRVFSTSKNKRLFRYLDYQMIITHLIRVSSKFQLLILMNTAMRMGLRVYSSSKSNRLYRYLDYQRIIAHLIRVFFKNDFKL